MTPTAWAYIIGVAIIAVLILVNNWASRAKDEEILQLRMTNDRQRGRLELVEAELALTLGELQRERTRHIDTQDTLALVEDINRALLVTNQHYAADEQARRDRAAARKHSRKGATT